MSAFAPPFQPGDYSTNAAHGADLGFVYRVGQRTFVVCKAAAALASPANKCVASALDATTKKMTYVVDTSTTAADKASVGIVPPEYTATIPINAYYLVQIGGPCEVISAAAIAAGVAVGTSTTAGKCDDASAVAGNELGTSLESAAAADELVGVVLTPRF